MKSDLLKLISIWLVFSIIGFIIWMIMLNLVLDMPFFGIGDLDAEQKSMISYAYRTYFQGPFSVEIKGTIGRNSIHQTRISGYIILGLIPFYLLLKKSLIKKILLVAIPALWVICPFLNFYLWLSGN